MSAFTHSLRSLRSAEWQGAPVYSPRKHAGRAFWPEPLFERGVFRDSAPQSRIDLRRPFFRAIWEGRLRRRQQPARNLSQLFATRPTSAR